MTADYRVVTPLSLPGSLLSQLQELHQSVAGDTTFQLKLSGLPERDARGLTLPDYQELAQLCQRKPPRTLQEGQLACDLICSEERHLTIAADFLKKAFQRNKRAFPSTRGGKLSFSAFIVYLLKLGMEQHNATQEGSHGEQNIGSPRRNGCGPKAK